MVEASGEDWQTLDTIWISNGAATDRARVQMRVKFAEVDNDV